MDAEERLLARRRQEVEWAICDLKTILVGSLAGSLNRGNYFAISIMTDGAYGSKKANVQGIKLQHISMGIRGSNYRSRSARTLTWRHRSVSPER